MCILEFRMTLHERDDWLLLRCVCVWESVWKSLRVSVFGWHIQMYMDVCLNAYPWTFMYNVYIIQTHIHVHLYMCASKCLFVKQEGKQVKSSERVMAHSELVMAHSWMSHSSQWAVTHSLDLTCLPSCLYVSHDSFTVSHDSFTVSHDSFAWLDLLTLSLAACLYVSHDSFTCVTWVIHR